MLNPLTFRETLPRSFRLSAFGQDHQPHRTDRFDTWQHASTLFLLLLPDRSDDRENTATVGAVWTIRSRSPAVSGMGLPHRNEKKHFGLRGSHRASLVER